MGESRTAVWVVDSEGVEARVRSELEGIQGIEIAGFRNCSDAVDELRKGSRPAVILGDYKAADAVMEVANMPGRYAGIRTAYVSELDLSVLAKTHKAECVRFGFIAGFVKKQ